MIFRSYESGQQFIDDNKEILSNYPIETRFFKFNANNMNDMSNGFAVKVIDNDKFVIALRYDIFPMVIYGDDSLLNYLVSELIKGEYHFERILASEKTVNAFVDIYEKLKGCTHKIIHSMDIMICNHIIESNIDISIVENASTDDIQKIAENLLNFNVELNLQQSDLSKILVNVGNEIGNFVLIKKDNKIVSMAKSCQEDDKVCAISDVYTLKEYRGQGFARKIMTFITKKILKKGKRPYLFVDKTNPVTNHLYSSIGYTYLSPQVELTFIPEKKE